VTENLLNLHPDEWATRAQRAAEEHLEECWASLDDEELEPETMAPFCGCFTCQVRETLHAAMPYLRAMIRAEGEERP